MADIQETKIHTAHTELAVYTTGTGSPAILLIHGNSFCSKIWRHIFSSDLVKTHRIIAFDLPGHGESDNAPDPEKSYNQPAYAEAAVEVLHKLDVKEVIILGWSLGGHIGIEMLPLFPGIKGLMIVGTPPVSPGQLGQGFKFPTAPKDAIAARDDLSEEELTMFAKVCADPPYEDWMLDCVKRTDPKARSLMFAAFDEPPVRIDQREEMAKTNVLIAVVNGANEPFINLEFVRNIKYKTLWDGKCFEMGDCLHAPFWGKPKEFQELFERFVKDVSV